MRRVGDHLYAAAEQALLDLVQAQRQQYRDGEAGQQRIEAEDERIDDDRLKLGRIEEALEVSQADPGAALNAEGGRILAEGDLRAIHRGVAEDDQPDERQKEQDVELPVAADAQPEAFRAFLPAAGRQTGEPIHPSIPPFWKLRLCVLPA